MEKLINKVLIVCLVALLCGVVGCSSSLKFDETTDPYTVTLEDIYAINRGEMDNECQLGGPGSTQGHSLCKSLMQVMSDKKKIDAELRKLSSGKFDLFEISVAILSVSAIAAESHISILEGLGILSASTVGFRNHANITGKRDAYFLASDQLQCLNASTAWLLWEDKSFYELRRYRRFLHESTSLLDSLIKAANLTGDELDQVNEFRSKSKIALDVADKAVQNYAATSDLVDNKRAHILGGMMKSIDESRVDVNTTVNGILSAKAVQAASDQEDENKRDEIEEAVAEGVPDDSSTVALSSLVLDEVAKSKDKSLQVEATLETATILAEQSIRQDAEKATASNTIQGIKWGTSRDRLKIVIGSMAESMRRISNLAKRYTQSYNSLAACHVTK